MKKNMKRMLGIGLAAIMGVSVLAGCGASGGNGSGSSSGQPGNDNIPSANENGMGRYVEEAMTVPFEADGENAYTGILDMRVLPDGKIKMLVQKTTYDDDDNYQQTVSVMDSEDGGKNWKESSVLTDLEFLEAEEDHHVDIDNAAIGPDGQIFIRVRDSHYTETEEDGMIKSSGTEIYSHYLIGSDGSAKPMTVEAENLPLENSWSYEYSPDGEETDEEMPVNEEEGGDDDIIINENGEDQQQDESHSYLRFIKFADADNLYLLTDEGGIYHYSLSEGRIIGSEIASDYIETVGLAGDELIVVTWENAEGFDIKTGQKKAEYPDLVKALQQVRGSYYLGDSTENGKVAYVGSTGIYSFDLASGENTMVVDGKLTSLVSTDTNIEYFLVKSDGEYMILMNDYMASDNGGHMLLNYAYDPEMPARPDKHLTVYSLEDDYWVEQVCAMFQKSHPDIYVDVVHGMTGDDAVTTSDAVRTLNTQVMGGEGPDIIFLKGLPTAAYVEKGILMDLTDLIGQEKSGKSFFENILDTYKTDKGTFAVPTSFSVPVIIGHKDMLDQIGSVEDLAKIAAQFADDKDRGENQVLIESYETFSLIGSLMPTNAGSWFKEDGSLDAQALKNYLTSIKQINESILSSSVDQEEIASMKEYLLDEELLEMITYSNLGGTDPTWDSIAIAAGSNLLGLGNLSGVQGLEYMYSAAKKDNDLTFKSMPGALENVYIPENIVGINAKTADADSSKEFISYLLTAEVQKYMAQYQGFPVNVEAFDKAMEDPEKDQPGYDPEKPSGGVGATDENGKEVSMDIYWPNEAYIAQFKDSLDALDTAAYDDEVILTTIIKDCFGAVFDTKDIDESVEQVMKDINIYLSE